jgi:hypothetical protein
MRIKINAINGPIYEVSSHHGQEILEEIAVSYVPPNLWAKIKEYKP